MKSESLSSAECRTCETVKPLDKKHFYKYKGKFWIYRCIECCSVHNKEYYRSRNPKSEKVTT